MASPQAESRRDAPGPGALQGQSARHLATLDASRRHIAPMKFSPSLLLALLTVTSLGTLALAWNRHLKVLDLALDNEQLRLDQAELRAELFEARHAGGFHVTLASDPGYGPALATETAPAPDPRPARDPGRDIPRGGGGFIERMQSPEFQAAQRARSQAMLDNRYADLFRRLNLPPAQLEQLKNLLVDRDTVMNDVMAAATAAGLNPRENGGEMRQLFRQAQEDIDQGIAQLLGTDGFGQYQNYQQTLPQRFAVNQLEQRLSYSTTPLTPAQSEQLVNLLARNARPEGNIVPPTGPGAIVRGGVRVDEQVLSQAAAILSPQQLEAFREMQTPVGRPGRGMGAAVPAQRLPGGG
jgi:hypothetical protein